MSGNPAKRLSSVEKHRRNRKRTKQVKFVLQALGVLLLLAYGFTLVRQRSLQLRQASSQKHSRSKGGASNSGNAGNGNHPTRSKTPAIAEGAWQRLDGCRLVSDGGNDGDSFRIEHQGQQHVVRLYFVDCPEKTLRRDNRRRLAEQAAAFGHGAVSTIPEAVLQRMVHVGGEARQTTLQQLSEGPFTVITRGERVYDSERIYAHVFVMGKVEMSHSLAEMLTSGGLARVHTKGENIPNLMSASQVIIHLRQLAMKAREQQLGAWRL